GVAISFSGLLPSAGRYDLLLYYVPGADRATNVPVSVDGQVVLVDETVAPPPGSPRNIGTFDLPTNPIVQIANDGTDGVVVVDAIRFRSHLDGVVVDDTDAKVSPGWFASTQDRWFVGDWFLHDGNRDKGFKSVVYQPALPAPGTYEVFFYYIGNGQRASNVPVRV